jgi:hypothetical protein
MFGQALGQSEVNRVSFLDQLGRTLCFRPGNSYSPLTLLPVPIFTRIVCKYHLWKA